MMSAIETMSNVRESRIAMTPPTEATVSARIKNHHPREVSI